MAAALLTPETVTLHNIPYVRDIITQRRLLEDIGATVLTPELRTHKITASHMEVFEAPYELVKTMRASVLALGPLLARFGKAKVSLPGGCAIGTRPIDLHLSGFEKFGAEVKLEAGNVVARAPADGRLRAADIQFNKVTVTGTENLMMAATLARGTTTLRNAAREPEIVDLADLLNKMGARVNGAGTDTIQIEGVADARRRGAHDHPGSDRNRNVHRGGRDHVRRARNQRLPAGPSRERDLAVAQRWGTHPGTESDDACRLVVPQDSTRATLRPRRIRSFRLTCRRSTWS